MLKGVGGGLGERGRRKGVRNVADVCGREEDKKKRTDVTMGG